MLAGRQDLLDFTHAARSWSGAGPSALPGLAAPTACSNSSRGQLAEEAGAKTLGVVVDSDLQIERERTAFGARRLSVRDSVLVSGRVAAFLYDLQVRHRAH